MLWLAEWPTAQGMGAGLDMSSRDGTRKAPFEFQLSIAALVTVTATLV